MSDVTRIVLTDIPITTPECRGDLELVVYDVLKSSQSTKGFYQILSVLL